MMFNVIFWPSAPAALSTACQGKKAENEGVSMLTHVTKTVTGRAARSHIDTASDGAQLQP